MIFRRILVLSMLAALALPIPGRLDLASAGEKRAASNRSGSVVLLHNGAVLRGIVERGDGSWSIETGPGATVVLPASAVLGVFESMESAFAWRKAQVGRDRHPDLVALGFWALRHDFPSGATDVLAECVRRGIRDPRVEALEREIRRIRNQASAALREDTRIQAPLRRTLSRDAIRRFHQQVEPILMARCGLSGCHGPGGTLSFRLVKPHPTADNARLETTHNLRTTLHLIGGDDWEQSRLLTYARRAHGSPVPSHPLTRESPEFRELLKWLQSLDTNKPHVPASVVHGATATPVLLQQPPIGGAMYDAVTRSADARRESTDPYDPAIFNRR